MYKSIIRAATVVAVSCLPFSASALNFTVTQFGMGQLGASQSNYTTILNNNFAQVFATEDFEGFDKLGQISTDPTATLSTDVGKFTTLGGKGSGSTAVNNDNTTAGPMAERGVNLSIRQNTDAPDNGGRQNTSFGDVGDPAHTTYLDSNDTLGFEWFASAGPTEAPRMFDRLLFTLTDPSDQKKTLTISALGYSQTFTIAPPQPNGSIFNVLIGFSSAVSSATISLAKDGTNDGFSIDNVSIGAVPLPAALWLLLGVSGVLVAAKRRSASKLA